MQRRRTAILTTALLLVAGCSDESDGVLGDGVDSEALQEAFEAEAEAAYEDADADRTEEFDRGVRIEEGCFALDDEGAAAVVEALGLDGDDAEVTDSGFLQGPPRTREVLTCNVEVGEDAHFGVSVGTTTLDRDEVLDLQEVAAGRGSLDLEVLDGDAPGLPADQVFGVDREGFALFGWTDGDMQASLSFTDELADFDRGFDALPVLLGEMARTLTAD
ncbi:MAG TPA: hypothetical protein VIL36_17585 [Acidimicrobiales bacterium]